VNLVWGSAKSSDFLQVQSNNFNSYKCLSLNLFGLSLALWCGSFVLFSKVKLMADLLEGLGDTGNQSGESALPGALGLSVEGAAELLSKNSSQDFTELLHFQL
jgi:hypothetical protein